MPNSRLRSRISRSTCACTVTSSAVVGSSAMSSLRPRGERHRDHRALAHAAREVVRIEVDGLRRRRDADAREHVDGDGARLTAIRRAVQAHHLDDLVADGVERRERAHGLLEDHRADATADRRG